MDRHFVCVDCGESFIGCEPPAEPDEDNPQCDDCICKMLDAFDAPPMTEDEVDRIMRKAGF